MNQSTQSARRATLRIQPLEDRWVPNNSWHLTQAMLQAPNPAVPLLAVIAPPVGVVTPPGGTGRLTITGTVYHDANNNAIREAGERPMRAIRVYLDLDDDARWDRGETVRLTDRAGRFTFTDLEPGRAHHVRVVPPRGWGDTMGWHRYYDTPPAGGLTVMGTDIGLMRAVQPTGTPIEHRPPVVPPSPPPPPPPSLVVWDRIFIDPVTGQIHPLARTVTPPPPPPPVPDLDRMSGVWLAPIEWKPLIETPSWCGTM